MGLLIIESTTIASASRDKTTHPRLAGIAGVNSSGALADINRSRSIQVARSIRNPSSHRKLIDFISQVLYSRSSVIRGSLPRLFRRIVHLIGWNSGCRGWRT